MVIDSVQKRYVMNMQLQQCFSRAKPFWLKKARKSQILSGFFYFQKKRTVLKKARIFKSGFEKAKLATLAGTQILGSSSSSGYLIFLAPAPVQFGSKITKKRYYLYNSLELEPKFQAPAPAIQNCSGSGSTALVWAAPNSTNNHYMWNYHNANITSWLSTE